MSYRTTEFGTSLKYVIEVISDISSKVKTNTIELKIHDFITDDVITIFKPNSVDSGNENKTFTALSSLTYTALGLKLYRQVTSEVINESTGELETVYSYVEVSPDVATNITNSVFFCCSNNAGTITIKLIEMLDVNSTSTTRAFEPSTTYKITFDLSKLISGQTGTKDILFVTDVAPVTGQETFYGEIANNVLHSINNLTEIKNIDKEYS